MIDELHKIKIIKEKKAHMAVKKQIHFIESLTQNLKQNRQDYANYQEWRKDEENRLFSEAKKNCLKLKELENLKQKVALFLEKEISLQEQVDEIQTKINTEKEKLTNLKHDAVIANKKVEKFEFLVNQNKENEIQRILYNEENEQEDNFSI